MVLRSNGIHTVNTVPRGLHFLNDVAGWIAAEQNDLCGEACQWCRQITHPRSRETSCDFGKHAQQPTSYDTTANGQLWRDVIRLPRLGQDGILEAQYLREAGLDLLALAPRVSPRQEECVLDVRGR